MESKLSPDWLEVEPLFRLCPERSRRMESKPSPDWLGVEPLFRLCPERICASVSTGDVNAGITRKQINIIQKLFVEKTGVQLLPLNGDLNKKSLIFLKEGIIL